MKQPEKSFLSEINTAHAITSKQHVHFQTFLAEKILRISVTKHYSHLAKTEKSLVIVNKDKITQKNPTEVNKRMQESNFLLFTVLILNSGYLPIQSSNAVFFPNLKPV